MLYYSVTLNIFKNVCLRIYKKGMGTGTEKRRKKEETKQDICSTWAFLLLFLYLNNAINYLILYIMRGKQH